MDLFHYILLFFIITYNIFHVYHDSFTFSDQLPDNLSADIKKANQENLKKGLELKLYGLRWAPPFAHLKGYIIERFLIGASNKKEQTIVLIISYFVPTTV